MAEETNVQESNVSQQENEVQEDSKSEANFVPREEFERVYNTLRKERDERKKLEKQISELAKRNEVSDIKELDGLRARLRELELESKRRELIDDVVSAIESRGLSIDRKKLDEFSKRIVFDDPDEYRSTLADIAETLAKPRQSNVAQTAIASAQQHGNFSGGDISRMTNSELFNMLINSHSPTEFSSILRELRNRVDIKNIPLPKKVVG
ncbi:MAG: hypothetical protein ACP5QX_06655 [Caldisericaceae bacterium]